MPTLESVIGKPYLSYSAVSTYLECGEKFRLTRVEKAPRRPAFWFHSGTAIHHGCDVFDHLLCDGVEPVESLEGGKAAALDKFKELVKADEDAGFAPFDFRVGGRRTKANPTGEDYAYWVANLGYHVQRYAEWRVSNPAYDIAMLADRYTGEMIRAIEIPFEVAVGDTKVHGYIDRVFTYGDEHVVVDLKSGSRVPADVTQLATYRLGIEQQYGITPRFGAYMMTRTGEYAGPVDISRFATLLPRIFEPVKGNVEREVFVPHVTAMCGSCEVADLCYVKNSLLTEPWTNPNMTQEASA